MGVLSNFYYEGYKEKTSIILSISYTKQHLVKNKSISKKSSCGLKFIYVAINSQFSANGCVANCVVIYRLHLLNGGQPGEGSTDSHLGHECFDKHFTPTQPGNQIREMQERESDTYTNTF